MPCGYVLGGIDQGRRARRDVVPGVPNKGIGRYPVAEMPSGILITTE
jgi:hypothetical protein